MSVLEFSMKGNPRPKLRPRTALVRGKPVIYTDEKTKKYEASIRDVARSTMTDKEPFQGPLSVSLRFRIGLAASRPKYEKAAILSGERPSWDGPDVDNMAKAVLDAMNAIVFLDDKQITRLFVTKVPHEKPGVDVRVEALAEPTP